jgi:hypothetical protein
MPAGELASPDLRFERFSYRRGAEKKLSVHLLQVREYLTIGTAHQVLLCGNSEANVAVRQVARSGQQV